MHVINSIKFKDRGLDKHSFHKTVLSMSFFDTNYFKCSNNFAADCTLIKIKNMITNYFFETDRFTKIM